MIVHSIHHNSDSRNHAYSVATLPGLLNKSALAESSPKMLLPQNPEYFAHASSRAMYSSSDIFQRYLEGIRYLARTKQRRCISEELA